MSGYIAGLLNRLFQRQYLFIGACLYDIYLSKDASVAPMVVAYPMDWSMEALRILVCVERTGMM